MGLYLAYYDKLKSKIVFGPRLHRIRDPNPMEVGNNRIYCFRLEVEQSRESRAIVARANTLPYYCTAFLRDLAYFPLSSIEYDTEAPEVLIPRCCSQ